MTGERRKTGNIYLITVSIWIHQNAFNRSIHLSVTQIFCCCCFLSTFVSFGSKSSQKTVHRFKMRRGGGVFVTNVPVIFQRLLASLCWGGEGKGKSRLFHGDIKCFYRHDFFRMFCPSTYYYIMRLLSRYFAKHHGTRVPWWIDKIEYFHDEQNIT